MKSEKPKYEILSEESNNYPKNRHFYQKAVSWHELPDRKIKVGKADLDIPENMISTSKYTFLTFIPINLWEQFSKLPNLYFLVSYFERNYYY